ncbi:Six-hairpin glycosidase-like protein [Chytridium lagenaria]|nr:Six-hairpin glycosidase-like protein [Chytridium lagenaria]
MAELKRIAQADALEAHWRRWGPYLSERAWATVREDYSHDGDAWSYFPFDHANKRVYRWGEDGIAGISDNHQIICFSLAMWNEKDDILKERLFGVTGHQGNHGEDVKECYFYLDNVPSHSYMKYLYKYPHARYPYENLVQESQKRSRTEGEYELLDTGIFDADEYFDIFIEYAKDATNVNDLHIKITAHNRSTTPAPLHLLPQIWFRNTWSWSHDEENAYPTMDSESATIQVDHKKLPSFLHADGAEGLEGPELLFCENETNFSALYNVANKSDYCKDGINNHIIHNTPDSVNPQQTGTKAAAWYKGIVPGLSSVTIRLRLTDQNTDAFDETFDERLKEADEFYANIQKHELVQEMGMIQRQAFAGMLWSKQFYHYVDWLDGDIEIAKQRWRHLHVDDILSMPDKWEYPFFAAWDTAFHAQLILLTREWYLHPNGQLPAYEWNFSDVNPPVHAWAVYRVYKIERKMYGRTDKLFLERMFQKLLMNFTWWVNRIWMGNNVFEGGFLGLDNIAVFNRSEALPIGGRLRQADGTSWMAMFSLNMLNIALELAPTNRSYEDTASKFFEHFMYISDALSWRSEGRSESLWNEEDGFYVCHLFGLIPLFAVLVLEPDVIDACPDFKRRMQWFLDNFDFTQRNIAKIDDPGQGERILLSLVSRSKLTRILHTMLSEDEFLSPYGIRSLSKFHKRNPYVYYVGSVEHRVDFVERESESGLFGGNSNWRGPIWMPTTFLIVESMQRFHHYYGDSFLIACPTFSTPKNLDQVADEIMLRTTRLFISKDGARPVNGRRDKMNTCPHWKNLVLFYEFFNCENGEGLGASHQTVSHLVLDPSMPITNEQCVQEAGKGSMGIARGVHDLQKGRTDQQKRVEGLCTERIRER